jgi:hypothetical protein
MGWNGMGWAGMVWYGLSPFGPTWTGLLLYIPEPIQSHAKNCEKGPNRTKEL